jgi:hypothetical protein
MKKRSSRGNDNETEKQTLDVDDISFRAGIRDANVGGEWAEAASMG